jgi:hypothetical protein
LASQNSKDLLRQESNIWKLGFMCLRPSKEEFSCPLKRIMQQNKDKFRFQEALIDVGSPNNESSRTNRSRGDVGM